MNVIKLVLGMVTENTYILSEDGKNAVVIDPGDDAQAIVGSLAENGLRCVAVLLTHAHFDHCNGCLELVKRGAKVYLHKKDELLVRTVYNLADKFGMAFYPFPVDVFLKGGETFVEAGVSISVIHTPGHTAGSCCYVVGNILFSGDTLFRLSIGRTDFPTGNAGQMKKSLAKLLALPVDYTVFPGHGMPTKLSYERNNNPYV